MPEAAGCGLDDARSDNTGTRIFRCVKAAPEKQFLKAVTGKRREAYA